MYLKIENDYCDPELYLLSEFLEMIDSKIYDINCFISKSSDPDSDGLCDEGEYYIGIGFVVIQQYLIDTLTFTKLNKSEAYSIGPMHHTNETYINLINAGANWWKHQAEWHGNIGEFPKNGETTFNRVQSIATGDSYQLSQLLHSLCGIDKLAFKALIPILIEWRDAIDMKCK